MTATTSADTPTVSLLVAMAENGVIGRDNDLPWRLPADLRRVKKLTTGHTLIMGRKTFDSIGRPLPRRRSIVLSRNPELEIPGAEVVADLATALSRAQGEDEVFVFGGAEVFRQALPLASRLYLTLVHAEVAGDVFFPDWDRTAWALQEDQRFAADGRHDHDYSFRVYGRRPGVTADA